MISISVTSTGDDQVLQALLDLQYRVLDLRPLAVRIGEIVQTDNMAARMLGVDKDGAAFAPLAPATLRKRRGAGPPLAPMEMLSRVVSDLTIDIVDVGIEGVDLIGSWPNMPFLIHHVTGTRNMPARDPVGVRPEGWAEIEAAVDEFLDATLSGGA